MDSMALRARRIGGTGTGSAQPERRILLVDGRAVGTVEVARAFRDRSRGLLGRDGINGALLLEPAMSVHTIGMRFSLDVAFCDRHHRVLAIRQMRPGRMTRPRARCRAVLEAERGSFAAWDLVAGSVLALGSELDPRPC